MALDRSTTWPYEDGEPGRFYYQRNAHPVGVEAEEELSRLEGGQALLFPSGAAATASLALALLAPGDTVALAAGAYYGTGGTFDALAPWGLRRIEFDQTGPPPEGVQLVWLETPANPFLTFPDLDPAIERAHAQGARVAVDATVATPALLRPLEHGADFVVHSATKALGGHDDVLLGVVVCRDAEDAARLLRFRGSTGIVAAPDAAWLLRRGLETLDLRVRHQSASALELARRLAAHPVVERVRYPGLGDEVAARYLDAFGCLLSFDVRGGADAARRVETGTRVIVNATSLGGTRSLLETRARWEGDRVPANLVRLSVGVEDVEALWDDLQHALARV